jgi:glutamyl-tRNA synthetase
MLERLERAVPFTVPVIEPAVRALTEELGLKLVDLAQLARLAATGRTASPPIFDVLALLGQEESLARLRRARAVAEGTA